MRDKTDLGPTARISSGSSFLRASVLLLLAGACVGAALAARFVVEGGRWPQSWPEELEPLRDRATTYDFSAGMEERSFVIPFDDREEFERVWPVIRSVATQGAPIRIVSAPRTYWDSETPVDAGVEIFLGRSSLAITTMQDGHKKKFELKAPWPKQFFQRDGTLYSHAVFDFENFEWVPLASDTKPSVGFRIRTDIMLIVDGDVIDPERIELPEDAAVIDQRKPTKSNHAKDHPEGAAAQ